MEQRRMIFFFMIFYAVGWSMYFVSEESLTFYTMITFILMGIFSLSHPVVYRYGILRALQLSISSVGIMSLFDSNNLHFTFSVVFVLILLLLESEDINSFVDYHRKKTVGLYLKRLLSTFIMPFSAVYVVMIIRPYDELHAPFTILAYFSVLYVFSKWFDTILSFGLFVIIQMSLLVFVIESYFSWGSLQITSFFASIFLFMLIGYIRKGLLINMKNTY